MDKDCEWDEQITREELVVGRKFDEAERAGLVCVISKDIGRTLPTGSEGGELFQFIRDAERRYG